MKSCADKKGIDFCSQCDEFPCETLKTFQAAAPHRRELWSSLEQIKTDGYEPWSRDMAALYACPELRRPELRLRFEVPELRYGALLRVLSPPRRGSRGSSFQEVVGADTNLPLWDGTRPDYDWAVAALVSEAGV
jgi:hypothetical protein